MAESSNGRNNPISYTYDAGNRLTKLTYGAGGKTYTYDAYGRLTQRGSIYYANTNIRENITYKTFSTGDTTNQIATWQNVSATYNVTYSYTYDDNGNITAISDGTNTTSYVYDSANQLIRENNQAGGFTKTWTYDDAGNILSRGEYAYTTGALGTPTDTVTYTYGDADWGDKLTAYDGNTITYDGVGNPLNDGTWTYTWKHGRQLVSMTDGTTTVSYTYNADGTRIGKTVTRSNYSETHKYFYDNGNLTYDIITVVDNGVTTTHDLLISYDESGRPMMITYDHVSYYYLLNAQGDVVAIASVTGIVQVAYTYDAWGNVLSITGPMAGTMGQWNQLRYRGYAYDQETGLYYLQSRYYDPEIGRFINADDYVSTGHNLLSKNSFTYCYNSPVMYVDNTGTVPWLIIGIIAVASIAVIAADHLLAANQPEDGYAVVNEVNKNGSRKKGLYAKGNGFELDSNGVTICDTEVGLVSCSVESKYVKAEIFDCLTASATAELDWSGVPSVDLSANASIYSPCIDVVLPLGFVEVTISLEALIGAVGIGIELDTDTGKFKITPPTAGVGGSIGFDFDLVG